MGDSDNPLGGIVGTVLLISFLPTILDLIQGISFGGRGQSQPQNTGIVPTGPGMFQVTQPTTAGGYAFFPGQTYSLGRTGVPLNITGGALRQPATFQDIATGPGSLFGQMRQGGVAW